MATSKKDESTPPSETSEIVVVSSHADGYRRAGRPWTREPTRVARVALTDEQLQALHDDPLIELQFETAA
jgi:hypothetical protein